MSRHHHKPPQRHDFATWEEWWRCFLAWLAGVKPVNPCLLRGTWINTPCGPRLIEDLAVGDQVSTMDHGPQPIIHISRRYHDAEAVQADPALRPYFVQVRGACAHVSKWHRILVGSRLISAHHLSICRPDLCWQVTEWSAPVEWLNLYTERHGLIAADGVAVETGWLGGPMAPRLLGEDWPSFAHLAEPHRTAPARPFVETLA